jgi:uncharacterized spore protein YtfJ
MTSVSIPQAADGFTTQTTQRVLDDLSRAAHPDIVFGQPIERGEVTIIPCSEILLGMGTGSGTSQNAPSEKAQAAMGQGSGGGGGVRGRPVASIVISRGTVTVVPIVDVTKLALAALTTTAFMALWIARLAAATSRTRPTRGAAARAMPRVPSMGALARRIGR